MGKLRLASADGEAAAPDPARERLREAVAVRDALATTLRALEGALPAAKERIWGAKDVHKAAAAGIDAAKQAAAEFAVSSVIGDAEEPAISVQHARRKLTEAEDALESARAAQAAIERRIGETTMSLSSKQIAVKRLAIEVIAQSPAIARAEDHLEQAQRNLVDKMQVLDWLISVGIVSAQTQHPQFSYQIPSRAQELNYRRNSAPEKWRGLIDDVTIPGERPFEAALGALMRDADAELPA